MIFNSILIPGPVRLENNNIYNNDNNKVKKFSKRCTITNVCYLQVQIV